MHPGQIDLLLTDVMMPMMTGPDLARSVIAIRPDIRVIFMSGYSADHIAPGGRLDPETTFIGKPFTREEIAARVRGVLDAPRRGS